MPQSQPDASRHSRATSRRDLLRFDFHRDPEQLSGALQALLDRSGVPAEERIRVLGGALVLEALRPYWSDSRTPAEAHALLRRDDPELADAIEAIAPMLLGRAQAEADARAALAAVAALLSRQ
ncbi:MAG: hypothetical protein WC273_04120 [Dehalococcoidia bacterium]